ncbi:MAG: GlxA family transcriptional regulator [Rhodobiaceae bacterium]|nr:GlxA family transcriptional regulator [Rhodobiaceae bacterium]
MLIPHFSMMCFSATVEPLRQANRLAGKVLYRWHFLSPDGEPVQASNGIMVLPEAGLDDSIPLDCVIVCCGIDAERFNDPATFSWLRRKARKGTRIGAISTGTIVLARAGLLHGYRSTIHWESLETYCDEFPELDISATLFEIDRDRFTCCGGIASLDLMHKLIEQDHGSEIAGAVSEQFLHNHVRAPDDPQRMALRERVGISHGRLLDVIELMENNLEEPLSRGQLAAAAGVSVRQLERLFRTYLGRTVGHYYLDLRLKRARLMLRQTSQSVLKVAVACGFVSASHFSRTYRQKFGQPPRADR